MLKAVKILIFPAEFLVILAIHRRSVVLSWGRYRCLSDGAYNASLLYPLRTFIVGAYDLLEDDYDLLEDDSGCLTGLGILCTGKNLFHSIMETNFKQ